MRDRAWVVPVMRLSGACLAARHLRVARLPGQPFSIMDGAARCAPPAMDGKETI